MQRALMRDPSYTCDREQRKIRLEQAITGDDSLCIPP